MKALLGVILMLPVAADDPTFTVSGSVHLIGEVPRPKPNKSLEADPACCSLHAQLPPQDRLVVDPKGGVRWTFVYVKKGLEGRTFQPPAEAVTIDQKGCTYEPHVVGAQVGQLVNFRNTDPLLHNVHGLPFWSRGFNLGQLQGSVSGVKFTAPEVPVKVGCDVHPWMTCFVGVVDHPYFAVTDAAGTFAIKKLPAGEYLLGIWHEGLCTPDEKNEIAVSVKADATVEILLKKK